jgi:hypothetical protein
MEERVVPAGNLTALVFDGILYLGGDSGGNQFTVAGDGNRAVRIDSIDGTTTINGQTSVRLTGVVRGVHYVGGSGDDIILVRNLQVTDTLNFNTGSGNDAIHLVQVTAGKGAILVTEAGNDQVRMAGSSFGSLASISLGAGDDYFDASGTQFSRRPLANGGTGTNSFNFRANSGRALGFVGLTPGADPGPLQPSNPPIVLPPTPPTPPAPVAPAVTLMTSSASPTNAATLSYTAVFDSSVTGFDASKISVANGAVASFSAVSGTNYNFTVTPNGSGVVSVSVAAGAGISAESVGSAASNTVSISVDRTAPTATIGTGSNEPVTTPLIPFVVTFSEAVTGLAATDFAVTNGSVANFSPTGTNSFVVNVTPGGDGTVTLALAVNSVIDVVGNGNLAASGAARSLRTSAGIAMTVPNFNSSEFVAVGTQGLRVREISVGTGDRVVSATSTVRAFYRGFLASNGNVFDEAVTTGMPAEFTNLITGFRQGITGMRAGGQRQIFIPAALGYGNMQVGSIPPNSDLVFDVILTDVLN